LAQQQGPRPMCVLSHAASAVVSRVRPCAGPTAGRPDREAGDSWQREGWGWWLRSLEKPARMSAQATAAALVTFALFKLTGMPQASWAVISALFVIQPDVGATIGTALWRIAGAAVGTGVGLACALAVGTSTWEIVLGLVVAIGLVGFIIG